MQPWNFTFETKALPTQSPCIKMARDQKRNESATECHELANRGALHQPGASLFEGQRCAALAQRAKHPSRQCKPLDL
jgi:hypothetical protein